MSTLREGKPGTRRRNKGGDLFVAVLKSFGIRHVTALTGGAIMEALDALNWDPEIDCYFFQTEAGAAWSAAGSARSKQEVGVCIVTSGPGATNTITAIADAHRDNVPLLIVTGQVPSVARNTDAFQETNITEVAAPIAKAVYYLSRAEDIESTLSAAFQTATSGRPGPVLIDFTKDAQQAVVDKKRFESLGAESRTAAKTLGSKERPLPVSQLKEAADLLKRAKRPVVVLGYGAVLSGIQVEIEAMLEDVACPVVHTLPGKPSLRSDHPLNFGMLGMHGFYIANWLIYNADLVISLGSRFDDRITGDTARFAPQAQRLIHFDISEEQVAKVLPERKLAVIGDLKQTFPAFREHLRPQVLHYLQWREQISAVIRKYPSSYTRRKNVLHAQLVIQTLNDIVEEHARRRSRRLIYATEVGDHQMWAGQYLRLQGDWNFLTSGGQGAMGSGLAMAIGGQIADPDALVICLAGDGSLRMSEAELETVIEYQLPIKILLFNNEGYGIVRMWNHRFYGGRESGVVKRGKQWNLLARANGFADNQVASISNASQLPKILRETVESNGPFFLELRTPYEECLPLMPPGKSFEELIF